MPNVYVLNKAAHDFSDAERFGELVYCTQGSIDKMDLQQMYREMSEALLDSQPDDYILLTSLASLCSIACSIFSLMHGRLNLLIFHNGAYYNRSIFYNED